MSRLLKTRLFNVGGKNVFPLEHLKLTNIEEPRFQQPAPRGKLFVIGLVVRSLARGHDAVSLPSRTGSEPVRNRFGTGLRFFVFGSEPVLLIRCRTKNQEPQTGSEPAQNRFETGSEPVRV